MEAAVNAVVRDKNITEQSEVDAMAKAIEDAIAALVEKPSSSGGFSSGSFFPSYPVNTPDKTENGTVTVSTKKCYQRQHRDDYRQAGRWIQTG